LKIRIPLLAGNWKMHKTVRESLQLISDLLGEAGGIRDRDIVVCPPFTALYPAGQVLSGKNIRLGAQDLYWEEKGAFTGEISPLMLRDVGCSYVIIGHSERRALGETDEAVNRKIKAALAFGLLPIVCVGESLEIREAGETLEWVRRQVNLALMDISSGDGVRLAIAYEPIWAIGTGRNDTPGEANKTIGSIRGLLGEHFGEETSQKVRILYGGSVKPANIDAFMAQPEIDGALVGGASLEADSFSRIIKYQAPGV